MKPSSSDRLVREVEDAAAYRARGRRRNPRDEAGGGVNLLVTLAIIAGLLWGARALVASVYRSQHCIYLFGHWLSVERTTDKLFCE